MSNTTSFQDTYASIGYLFYSIAASDGRIAPAETERLKEEVRKHWLPLENSRDEFGTDAAHYIGISFEYANNEGMGAEDAYDRFVGDYKSNPSRFDPIRGLIVRTATAIANAFAGKNKSELVRLSRLRMVLQG